MEKRMNGLRNEDEGRNRAHDYTRVWKRSDLDTVNGKHRGKGSVRQGRREPTKTKRTNEPRSTASGLKRDIGGACDGDPVHGICDMIQSIAMRTCIR